MLKKHLATDHDLTPQDYRARWNLPVDYPMVAPDYAQKRRELAVKIGLGRKPKAAAPAPATPKRGRPKAAPARTSVCRSEEHTSELQSLMRISYAVFCLQKQK